MKVKLEEGYAEACRVIGEQIVTQRLLTRDQPEPQKPEKHHGDAPVLEQDGYKVYAYGDDEYAVACAGQWLSGRFGPTPEEALAGAKAEVAKG